MHVPDHPRDITIGSRPPHPCVLSARTDHTQVASSLLSVEVPASESQHALRLMISTITRRGRRHVEVAQLWYRSDRQQLTRWLAALEPDAAQQGIADAAVAPLRERG